jgi:hypothetical protein
MTTTATPETVTWKPVWKDGQPGVEGPDGAFQRLPLRRIIEGQAYTAEDLPSVGSLVIASHDSADTAALFLGRVERHDLSDTHQPLMIRNATRDNGVDTGSRWVTWFAEVSEATGNTAESREERLIAEQKAYIERLQRQLVETRSSARDELEAFKEQVRDTAMEYADRYGWCNTVKEALFILDSISDMSTSDLSLDSDWENVNVDSVDVAVSDIEPAE